MNSDEIFDAVEDIASTTSTKAKLEKLKEYIQDYDFRRICLLAYHPHYVYGVKDIPEVNTSGSKTWETSEFKTLDGLKGGVLSGNTALDTILHTMENMSSKSAELFARVIRKDLRCGISRKTINKAYPNLLPEFPYMRCCLPKDAKLDAFSWENGCFSQEKADGMFVNMDISKKGVVCMYGREGNLFNLSKFVSLVNEARSRLMDAVADRQYHGELLVERDGKVLPREIANGLINSANNGDYEFAGNERVLYKVWDVISPRSKSDIIGYRNRFMSICKKLMETEYEHSNPAIGVIPTKIVYSLDEAKAHFKEMTSQGKEGTILKDGDAIWKNGTSKQQVKFKVEFDCDLEIVGFVEGQKATKNEGRVGSITCQSSDGKLKVDVAIKGETMRDAVDADRSAWLGKVMTVKANNIMPPTESNELYSLFLPRFVETEYRQDKSEADSLERIQASFDAAI